MPESWIRKEQISPDMWEIDRFCAALKLEEIETLCEWLDYTEKWIAYKIQCNKGKDEEHHWRQRINRLLDVEVTLRQMRETKKRS